mgnify:CR=1 FL=1
MNLIESIKKVIKEAEEELLNKVIDFFIHKGEVDIKELRYFGVDDKEQIQNIMNRFFNEKFIPVYTNTGLIREVVSDLFFIDDTLIVH